MATIIQQLAASMGIPPELFGLLVGILGIVATIAHSRGYALPVISMILSALGAKQGPVVPAAPADPAAPAAPSHLGDGHIIRSILADIALLKLALPAQAAVMPPQSPPPVVVSPAVPTGS